MVIYATELTMSSIYGFTEACPYLQGEVIVLQNESVVNDQRLLQILERKKDKSICQFTLGFNLQTICQFFDLFVFAGKDHWNQGFFTDVCNNNTSYIE